MRLIFTGLAVALTLSMAQTVQANTFQKNDVLIVAQSQSGFQRWVKNFRKVALTKGISARTYDRAFKGVKLNTRVMQLDRKQAEFSRQIWDYLDTATSPKRVKNGRAMLAKHKRTLSRIEQKYGVDKKVVLSIWGLESSYGKNMGDINIIEALATLAYDGRREKFGKQQLLEALRIIQRGDIRQ